MSLKTVPAVFLRGTWTYALLLGFVFASHGLSDTIFVLDNNNGLNGTPPSSIGEYTTSGTTVNGSLISGIVFSPPFAVSGSNLFLANVITNSVSEYTTSGSLVNPSAASLSSGGFVQLQGLAVAGSDLFLLGTNLNDGSATISEFTTSGTLLNSSLISIAASSFSGKLAVSGPDLLSRTPALARLANTPLRVLR